jgi:hypothetical protein
MKLIKIFAILIIVMVFLNITLTNRSLDDSMEMSNLSSQILTLIKVNNSLKAEIATSASLTSLKPKISSAGYTETSPHLVTLGFPASVALAK